MRCAPKFNWAISLSMLTANAKIFRVHSQSESLAGDLGSQSEAQAVGLEVLLVDPVVSRREAISQTIVQAGGRCVADMSELGNAGAPPTSCRIALVALGKSLNSTAPELEVIARLRKRGRAVIAYEDDLQKWDVRSKCLPLLAGADHVLDSRNAGFAADLRRLLEEEVQALAQRRLAEQAVQPVMRQHGMVGTSPQMLAVFRKAIRFSSLSDPPILIVGETGTGKELVARAMHRLDPKRKQGAFVAVNCAAISPSLVESEFFGHRRGAFTGAERTRKGLIRAAERGVLFLDEIGELELGLQAKLLRVLQENTVLTVGEEHEVPVNVRFIAATNRDLERMVAELKFRGDLFHRLRVLLIRIPPLRERPSDLAPLVEHFLRKHHNLKAKTPPGVSLDFVEALRQLNLPGNARQVENLVCEALVKHQGDGQLGLNDLPLEVLRRLSEPPELGGVPSSNAKTRSTRGLRHSTPEQMAEFVNLILDGTGWSLSRAMCEYERLIFWVALQRARGNQSEAARLLGITPRSVYKKLDKYQLRG